MEKKSGKCLEIWLQKFIRTLQSEMTLLSAVFTCDFCSVLKVSFHFSFSNFKGILTCFLPERTRTTTRKMAAHLTVSYAVYAHAPKAGPVTPLTGSLTPSFHGVFLIPETDIITGRDCMDDWNGTVTSALLSQILSPWVNRSATFSSF